MQLKFVIACFLCGVLWLPSQVYARNKVVVAKLSGLGVAPDIMKRLEDYLRGEISRIPNFEVVSSNDQERILRSIGKEDLQHAMGDIGKLKQLATIFKASYIVQGTVATLGEKIQFNVKSVYVPKRKKATISIVQKSIMLEGKDAQLIPGVRLIAYQLFAPDQVKASIKIAVPLDNVDVIIDDKKMGKTPFDKPILVNPGKHKVQLVRDGYQTLAMEITTHPLQTTVVKAVPSDKK